MVIRCIDHYNRDQNRQELLLEPFNYYDGIDMIADLLLQYFGDSVQKASSGLFYRTLLIRSGKNEYTLVWHEDIGTYVYSSDPAYFPTLKKKISYILQIINLNSSLQ